MTTFGNLTATLKTKYSLSLCPSLFAYVNLYKQSLFSIFFRKASSKLGSSLLLRLSPVLLHLVTFLRIHQPIKLLKISRKFVDKILQKSLRSSISGERSIDQDSRLGAESFKLYDHCRTLNCMIRPDRLYMDRSRIGVSIDAFAWIIVELLLQIWI